MGAREQRRRRPSKPSRRFRPRRARPCPPRGRWSPRRSRSPSGTAPRAIHELDTIAVPTSPQLAQSYWWLRGKAAFLTGHPVEGTRAFVERERYIADAQALRASREELLALHARRGPARRLAQGSAENRCGRRRLARARTDRRRDGAQSHARRGGARRLEARIPAPSRRRHPRRSPVPSPLAVQGRGVRRKSRRAAPSFPSRSHCFCRCRAVPRASAPPCATASSPRICNRIRRPVRAAKSTTSPPSPWPAPTGMPSTTARHSSWARSPRRMSPQWCRCAPRRRPQLALNFLGDSVNAGTEFYQFALLPEDEARGVARRAASPTASCAEWR